MVAIPFSSGEEVAAKEVADGFQTADFVSPGLGNLHLEKACLLVKIEQKTFHFITFVRMEQWEWGEGRNISSRDHTGGLDHQSSLELASKPVLSYIFPNMKPEFEDLRSPCHPNQGLELEELASSGWKQNEKEV